MGLPHRKYKESDMPNPYNRLTITGFVHHQNSGQNPTSFALTSSTVLNEPEQAYLRQPVKGATSTPEPISLGWLRRCLLLLLRNMEEPPEMYSQEWWDRTIRIGYTGHPLLLVPPGLVTILYPHPGQTEPLMISCGAGEAKYTLFGVPS